MSNIHLLGELEPMCWSLLSTPGPCPLPHVASVWAQPCTQSLAELPNWCTQLVCVEERYSLVLGDLVYLKGPTLATSVSNDLVLLPQCHKIAAIFCVHRNLNNTADHYLKAKCKCSLFPRNLISGSQLISLNSEKSSIISRK